MRPIHCALGLAVATAWVGVAASSVAADHPEDLGRDAAALRDARALAPAAPRPQAPSGGAAEVAPSKPVETDGKPIEPTPVEQTALPKWFEQLAIEGRAFLRYSYEVEPQNGRDYNEFDVDRIYVGFNWKPASNVRVRYTLEGGDLREGGGGNYDVTSKHFYVEIYDLPFAGVSMKFGQADLPWVPYAEGFWGYRAEGTVFADRSGYLTSTDLGIGCSVKLPSDMGSIAGSVVNGEGWKSNELNKHKDVHGRVTLNPLGFLGGPWKGLFLTAFATLGTWDDAYPRTGLNPRPGDKNRVILQAGFHLPGKCTVVGELLWAQDPAWKMAGRYPSLAGRNTQESDARGWSVFGRLSPGLFTEDDVLERLELLGRLEWLDPDDEVHHNHLHRAIAGIAFQWSPAIMTLFAFDAVNYQSGALLRDGRRISFHVDVKF